MASTYKNYFDTLFWAKVENQYICENMIKNHMLVHVVSGEMVIIDKGKRHVFVAGDTALLRKNHLVRKIKQPSQDGTPFVGVFLNLSHQTLKSIYGTLKNVPTESRFDEDRLFINLNVHPFFQVFFSSVKQYFESEMDLSKELVDLKLREAVEILIQIDPTICSVLFDFRNEWKIDLVEFMNKNFKSDLSLEQFAHFSGRSLSSFKREFKDLFNNTPSRWIVQKRLEEAYYLIVEKSLKPSFVYDEVGFKNISHFSTAFKKEFGIAPSQAVPVSK